MHFLRSKEGHLKKIPVPLYVEDTKAIITKREECAWQYV